MKLNRVITFIFLLTFVTQIQGQQAFPLELSGFVDAQGQWIEKEQEPGFLINDGAIYLTRKQGTFTLLVDLAFTSGGETNDFEFATEKSQAYLAGHHENGFFWQFGRFDSVVGFEANDSLGHSFARSSAYTGAFPSTFTGLMTGYDRSEGMSMALVIANLANSDSPGTRDLDVSGVLSWDNDLLRGYLSFLEGESFSGGSKTIVDFSMGKNLASMAFDLEMSHVDVDGLEGWSALLQGIVGADDVFGWGWRLEHTEDQNEFAEAQAVTLGPAWRPVEPLVFKLSVNFARETLFNDGEDETNLRVKQESWSIFMSGLYQF